MKIVAKIVSKGTVLTEVTTDMDKKENFAKEHFSHAVEAAIDAFIHKYPDKNLFDPDIVIKMDREY